MLKNHTILYDAECPLCTLYTGAFIKCGMLDQDGREEFGEALKSPYIFVDWKRAGTEIALIDHRRKTVSYGIDSLFKILGHNLPLLNVLFRIRIFRLAMKHIYFFISYNRKVIAPSSVFEEHAACRPAMNRAYRIAYILISCAVTSLVLTGIAPSVSFPAAFACTGIFAGTMTTVVAFVRRDRWIYYGGNLMTVLLIGVLTLLPYRFIQFMAPPAVVFQFWVAITIGVMAFVHHRRLRSIGLPLGLTLTWGMVLVALIGFVYYR